jgi:hypothetical protein
MGGDLQIPDLEGHEGLLAGPFSEVESMNAYVSARLISHEIRLLEEIAGPTDDDYTRATSPAWRATAHHHPSASEFPGPLDLVALGSFQPVADTDCVAP